MVNLTVTQTVYLPTGYRSETHLASRLDCQKDLPTVFLLTESLTGCHLDFPTGNWPQI